MLKKIHRLFVIGRSAECHRPQAYDPSQHGRSGNYRFSLLATLVAGVLGQNQIRLVNYKWDGLGTLRYRAAAWRRRTAPHRRHGSTANGRILRAASQPEQYVSGRNIACEQRRARDHRHDSSLAREKPTQRVCGCHDKDMQL